MLEQEDLSGSLLSVALCSLINFDPKIPNRGAKNIFSQEKYFQSSIMLENVGQKIVLFILFSVHLHLLYLFYIFLFRFVESFMNNYEFSTSTSLLVTRI